MSDPTVPTPTGVPSTAPADGPPLARWWWARRLVARGGLRRLALARLALASGVSIALMVVTVVVLHAWLTERARAAVEQSWNQFYDDRLARIDHEWHQYAEQLVRQLEFARSLERPVGRFHDAGDETWSDELRWSRLTAFLDHQRVTERFSMVAVIDALGQVRFRYGTLTRTAVDPASLDRWVWVDALRELHHVERLPVWMGADGEGTLVVFAPLDERLAQRLTIPGISLTLDFEDQTVLRVVSGEAVDAADHLVVERAWPNHDDGPSPRLRVSVPLPTTPITTVLSVALLAVFAVLLVLWWTLGRFLDRLSTRIAALDDALAQQMARSGLLEGRHAGVAERLTAVADASAPSLDALARCSDEVGHVAKAMQRMLKRLAEREIERAAHLDTLSMLDEAIVETTCDGTIQSVSAGWHELVGGGDPTGRSLFDFVAREDVDDLSRWCERLRAATPPPRNPVQFRARLRTAHGAGGVGDERTVWVEGRFLALPGPDGRYTRLRGVLRDVTQSQLYEREISHMSLHDALTGLPNRVLLEDRVAQALRSARQTGRHVAVCFFDVDHFKNVNDTLGHKLGDALLVEFARRVDTALAPDDTFARWGGDEFVLLMVDRDDDKSFAQAIQSVVDAASRPFRLDHVELRVTLSGGVALFPRDASDATTLFAQADRALFHAKLQGRNQVAWVRDMAKRKDGQNLYLQARLTRAIEERRIQAVFQPIVTASTRRFAGVEVLARWEEPDLGPISPAVFIPMAESLGRIREIGELIFDQALDALAELHAAGHAVPMAVNVSKRQLFLADFALRAEQDVRRRGLEPSSILFEITESLALVDVENAGHRIQQLVAAGFRIAIDDFGTGYSSLSQLHELTAHELKIDMSFVRRLHEPSGLAMVKAILEIARAMGLATIAEGVEDEQVANRLCMLGVDYLQGYHFSRPSNLASLLAWAASQSEGGA